MLATHYKENLSTLSFERMENLQGIFPKFVGEIDASQLKRIKRIASGGMSEIHLYEWTTTEFSFQVAMKCLTAAPIEKRYKSHLKSEMSILASLQHENIVKTFGTVETDYNYGLVLEYLPFGSYRSFFHGIRREIGHSEDSENRLAPLKIQIISEIIAGMQYLHGETPQVFHLDLKSDNILLNHKLQAKICDFGLSAMTTLASLKSSTTSVGVCQPDAVPGTIFYLSPTRLRHCKAKASNKSDVYSFGILQWEILTDRQLYEGTDFAKNHGLLGYHVGSGNVRPDEELVPTVFPQRLTSMMIQAWSHDRKDRPEFSELYHDIRNVQDDIDDYDEKVQESMQHVLSVHKLISKEYIRCETHLTSQTSSCDSFHIDELVNPDSVTVPKTPPNPGSGAQPTINLGETKSNPCRGRQNLSIDFQDVTPSSYPGYDRGIVQDEEIRGFEDMMGEATPLLKTPDPYIHERKSFISNNKILIIVALVISVSTAVGVLIWKETEPSVNDCRSLSVPLHGNISCTAETDKIKTKKCRFSCDFSYKLVGKDIITCDNGNWNSPAPTCEKACSSLPKVPECGISCTNGYFVNSVCTFKCLDNHVIQGHNALTCLNNSNWSNPEPSCICPKCQIGDKCQHTTSWMTIAAALEEIVIYVPMTLDYGGHAFHCEVHMHGFVKWSASCTDNDTKTKHSCNNHSHGFVSPATAGKSAAAELIKDLVKKLKYPKPCDPQDFPTDC